MRVVTTHLFDIGGKGIQAKLFYGDDDLVAYWEMLYRGLNLSLMTYQQVQETTGLTPHDIERAGLAIQLWIDRQEGRA